MAASTKRIAPHNAVQRKTGADHGAMILQCLQRIGRAAWREPADISEPRAYHEPIGFHQHDEQSLRKAKHPGKHGRHPLSAGHAACRVGHHCVQLFGSGIAQGFRAGTRIDFSIKR